MPIAALLRLAERYPIIVSVELAAIVVTFWWWSGGNVDLLTMDGRTWHGEFWRPFSSALPHVNILHLVFNLSVVGTMGTWMEEVFGSLVTMLWLLVFAGGSMVADYDLAEGGVGLSGVAYGLFGFLWVLSKRDYRFRDAITPQTTQFIVGWFFFCIATTYLGLMPVANVAHGAGAGLGALAGLVMSPASGYRRPAAAATLAIALVAVFAAGAFARSYVNLTGSAGGNYIMRQLTRCGAATTKAPQRCSSAPFGSAAYTAAGGTIWPSLTKGSAALATPPWPIARPPRSIPNTPTIASGQSGWKQRPR